MNKPVLNKITAGLLGLAVGDALGVPVEFQGRVFLKQRPVTTMQGHGTHDQPAGTWSDNSSLSFCLAESLCKGYDLSDIAHRFINWSDRGYWTARGRVFAIGVATSTAITKLRFGVAPTLAGGRAETDNGNGSLMRLLPLVFYLYERPISDRYRLVTEVSSLTHGHIRSVLACFIYTELARCLLVEPDKDKAFTQMKEAVNGFIDEFAIAPAEELVHFQRILDHPALPAPAKPLAHCHESDIQSSGYVVHTLEASLWCFLTTDSFTQAVLKAVNLGGDTDTIGSITGGLAGLRYGVGSIPKLWLSVLARRTDIEDLAERLSERL
ncbi:ADP-ribosylglycohydrolase [Fibrella aestuarina BUZ 2]|uniref:ADP-ribosylglycohydrolase n=1 Tax=Fibrella aestuarina BUZ 2 TaxID=1166018 RepID=I0KC29_9BACT|nr:ADP-ribosylglycohydrolase family protein [Fibrella aestuarina]CCH01682.1 ADP-ribosylglycohydrolase [Fibrella aestuarina BUZ 2]